MLCSRPGVRAGLGKWHQNGEERNATWPRSEERQGARDGLDGTRRHGVWCVDQSGFH